MYADQTTKFILLHDLIRATVQHVLFEDFILPCNSTQACCKSSGCNESALTHLLEQ